LKPLFSKIRVISLARKTSIPKYHHRPGNVLTLRTGCIKVLGA
jgi:hypothetical protein